MIIVQAVTRFDRFSGNLRLNLEQIWDLPSARVRFGKYLLASVQLAGDAAGPDLQRVLREHPAKREVLDTGDEIVRGLPVRLQLLQRYPEEQVQGMLKLGDASRFYPSDAALAGWMALLPRGEVRVVYE